MIKNEITLLIIGVLLLATLPHGMVAVVGWMTIISSIMGMGFILFPRKHNDRRKVP